jgi:hypothetical protein
MDFFAPKSLIKAIPSKYEKIWGQVRGLAFIVGSTLITIGVLKTTPESINAVLDGIWNVVKSIDGVIASLGMIWASISSWVSKKPGA